MKQKDKHKKQNADNDKSNKIKGLKAWYDKRFFFEENGYVYLKKEHKHKLIDILSR